MDLQGKRVAFLGDSITEGVGTTCAENRYTDVFARISGCEVLNYGVGGSRIAPQKILWNAPGDHDFIERADAMEDADIVVVFGGTNDFGSGDEPLGAFPDQTEETFYGALHVLFKKLIDKYPRSEIIVLTPLHRETENKEINWKNKKVPPLIYYVQAIREVAEYYALPVLDLYKLSGMQPSVESNRAIYMPDGLHPSDVGAAKIAERLYNFLRAL